MQTASQLHPIFYFSSRSFFILSPNFIDHPRSSFKIKLQLMLYLHDLISIIPIVGGALSILMVG